MLTATMLVMVIAVVAVLFGGLALIGRARGRSHSIGGGGNDMSWSPAFYSGGGNSGCDSGGGSDGGGGGCDGGGGGGA